MTLDLNALLTGQVYALVLLMCRIGPIMMMFPGIGESYVNHRTRVLFILMLSVMLAPVLAPNLPTMPTQIPELARVIVGEVIVGVFFGTMLRMLTGVMEIAGTIIAFQAGLANATMFNPAFASQGTLPGVLLSAMTVLLIFSTGMEGMLLNGIIGTYDVFRPGAPMMMEDIAGTIIQLMGKSFAIGVQMTVPFMVLGLLVFVPMAVMVKMMPQLQILLLMLPLQVLVGIAVLLVTIPAMLKFWGTSFTEILRSLLVG